FMLDCKGVVGKDVTPAAVTKFHSGYDDVKGGERLLPLEPTHATLAWRVGRVGRFQHQSFIASRLRFREKRFERHAIVDQMKRRYVQSRRPADALDDVFSRDERLVN